MKKKIDNQSNWIRQGCSGLLFFAVILMAATVFAARDVAENEWILSYSGGVDGEVIVSATREIYNIGAPYQINATAAVALRAPTITLTPGFHAAGGSRVVIGAPAFYLHFVVMSEDADFPDHDGLISTCGNPGGCCPKRGAGFHCLVRQDAELLVQSINRNFISEDGKQVVRFRLAGFSAFQSLTATDKSDPLYESISNTDAAGTWLGNNYSGSTNDANFDSCTRSRLRNASAMNVYLYENRYAGEGGFSAVNNSGHGRNNQHQPFVLVDFDRFTGIDGTTGMPVSEQRPIEHELGHAFNLDHVCQDDQALPGFDTNLMSQGVYCQSLAGGPCDSIKTRAGGNREGGFAYDSLLNCPDSSQAWCTDHYDPALGCPGPYQSWCDDFLPDDDDGNPANPLGQMEIIYWNSVLIQQQLMPDYPY